MGGIAPRGEFNAILCLGFEVQGHKTKMVTFVKKVPGAATKIIVCWWSHGLKANKLCQRLMAKK